MLLKQHVGFFIREGMMHQRVLRVVLARSQGRMACQSGGQFSKIQSLISENRSVLPSLLWLYRQIMGDFFTRDLRSILDECIVAERLELLNYNIDVSADNNKLLLLQPKTGMNAFVTDFHDRVLSYYQGMDRLACSCDSSNNSDRQRLAFEDRKVCYETEFKKKFLADNGYSFLLAVRKILDFEASLLQKHSKPAAFSGRITLLKRELSSDSVSEKAIILTHFQKRIRLTKDTNQLKDVELALCAFNESEFLNQLSFDNLTTAVDELANYFSVHSKRELVNDDIKRFEINSLVEAVDFEKLHRASEALGCTDFNVKLKHLLSKSLVVLTQSCQVIREKKHVKFNIELLFGDFFSKLFQFEALIVDVTLLNEDCVRNLEANASSLKWDELRNASAISLRDRDGRQLMRGNKFSAEISLQVTKLPTRKNPVWAQKFAFHFRAHCKDLSIDCLSRPVTFITNDNQRMESSACIAYENMFPMPVRMGFDVLKSISADQCVDLMDRYIFDETRYGLERQNRFYFLTKCQELMTKTGNPNCITFDDLIKVPFIGKGKSLWDFVYTCVKFIKDHAHSLWMNDLLYGFISKTDAIDTIKQYVEKEKEKRDFALLRFSETTATVTVCYSTNETSGTIRILNLTPKPETYFNSTPLAKFCDDPLSPRTMIVKRSGSLQDCVVLRGMIPREEDVPGYVPLRRRGGASESMDVMSDLTSSVASVSVWSPANSDFSMPTSIMSPPAGNVDIVQRPDSAIADHLPIPESVVDFVLDNEK